MESDKASWERYKSRFTSQDDYTITAADETQNAGNSTPNSSKNTSTTTNEPPSRPPPGTPSSWNHIPLVNASTSTGTGTTGDGGGSKPLDKRLEYSPHPDTVKNMVALHLEVDTLTATTMTTTTTTTPPPPNTMAATPNESRVQSPPPPTQPVREDGKEDEDIKEFGAALNKGSAIDMKRDTHHHSAKRDRDGNPKQDEDEREHQHHHHRTKEGEDLGKEEDNMDSATANMMNNNNNNNNNNGSDAKEGLVQRKRVCRQRGSQQAAAREGRKFRSKERDGWHGRAESSSVMYKMGEGLPEIAKRWKEHASAHEGGGPPPTLEVRIPADLATTLNKQVRGSQLWGTDIYTEDSDLVAVLMHTGYYCPTSSPPPSCVIEIRATIQVLPPQNGYRSMLRNSVRSRAWGAASGCSYSIERCRIMKDGGGFVELESCLDRVPVVAPTLAPAAMERTMTTRSASSNSHRQQKYVQEVTIMYNLCNEPWFKYTMSIVADRGLKRSQYTSARLKKGDVLYLETPGTRYELSHDGEKGGCNGTTGTSTAQGSEKGGKAGEKHNGTNGHSGEYAENYKWARCTPPLPLSVVQSKGVPLPPDSVEVVEEGLGWEEIRWSPTSVWIRGKEYVLTRAQFLTPRPDAHGKCSLG